MTVKKLEHLPNLLRGNTEALLLFLVNEMESAYGYQLIKEIGRRSQGFFNFKEGTVYPTLRKMENEGLIKGRWEGVPSGQERRYYGITDKGREELGLKLATWQSFTDAMNLVLRLARS